MADTKATVPPNQSLYLQNLPEKLHKPDLRRALYCLFTPHGPVLDITALKTRSMRGQAHVLFKDTQTATQAMRACQGFDFFGREMRISYSRNRSQTLAKMTGTVGQDSKGKPTGTGAGGANGAAAAAGSSFPAPPGTAKETGSGALPPPPGLPAKVAQPETKKEASPAVAGTKREREESDDEAMEEEDESEGAMEMSDED